MELWMAVVLAVIFAAIATTIVQITQHNARRRKEEDLFMEQANDAMSMKIDTQAVTAYNAKKRSIFDSNKSSKSWDDNKYIESQHGNADQSWQRELETKESASLKAALMKRAMSLVPLLQPFQQEVQSRFHLLQRGLLGEKQWVSTMGLRDKINEEVMEILHEADCLSSGFGSSGQIFREARGFYEHEVAKQRTEMIRGKLISMAMADGKSAEEAARLAELHMADLMRQAQKNGQAS